MLVALSLAVLAGTKVAEVVTSVMYQGRVEAVFEARFPGHFIVQFEGKTLGLVSSRLIAASVLFAVAGGDSAENLVTALPSNLPEERVLAYLQRVGRVVQG